MLYDTVTEYLRKGVYPFHMPGHKRNPLFMPPDLLSLDMTEIPGLDNLHQAEGAIRSVQEKIASVYGAGECLLSVNGSTAGIIAAICSACPEGSLLMARNSHVSAFSGLVFSGARPVYLYPDETPYGICGGVSPARVRDMLAANPGCQAVFITSPTYEGFVSDIKTIAGYVHEKGRLLIVDEAHGAHFPFHPIFPDPAIQLGADIVITSPHKTLPALTQTALALVREGGGADAGRLKFFMRACQTSSPSYIIMSVTDYIFQILSRDKNVFGAYADRLLSARKALAGLNAFRLVGDEIAGTASIHALDAGKMLFISTGGLSGAALDKGLAEEFRVQLEMSAGHFALAMTSAADTDEGFERLVRGIKAIDAREPYEKGEAPRCAPGFKVGAQSRMTPREAVFSPSEQTDPRDSAGKISADFVSAYPPGIPVIAPGELITEGIARELSRMGRDRIKTVKGT